ncbi:MAG: hypothetical protein ACFB0A_08095 [Croceivirga sp.]
MTVGVSTLYVLAPLHEEIREVGHNIAHYIEAPISFLEHTTYRSTEFHTAHEHIEADHGHEHLFIDFLGAFLEKSSSEKSPMKNSSLKLKVDKHIISEQKFKRYVDVTCAPAVTIWKYIIEVLLGYRTIIYVPPQNIDTCNV